MIIVKDAASSSQGASLTHSNAICQRSTFRSRVRSHHTYIRSCSQSCLPSSGQHTQIFITEGQTHTRHDISATHTHAACIPQAQRRAASRYSLSAAQSSSHHRSRWTPPIAIQPQASHVHATMCSLHRLRLSQNLPSRATLPGALEKSSQGRRSTRQLWEGRRRRADRVRGARHAHL